MRYSCIGWDAHLIIHVAGCSKERVSLFDGSEGHCKEMYVFLQRQCPGLFEQQSKLDDALYSDGTKSGFKPLILLPGQSECCGKKIQIRYVFNRQIHLDVYTKQRSRL